MICLRHRQNRILAKVDTLMTPCDLRQSTLTTADTIRAHLLDALLHEALDPGVTRVVEAAE